MTAFSSLVHLVGISGRLPRLPPSLAVLQWGVSERRGAAAEEFALLQVEAGQLAHHQAPPCVAGGRHPVCMTCTLVPLRSV
jgi:hypothetical protein